jgi:hypothetical protein
VPGPGPLSIGAQLAKPVPHEGMQRIFFLCLRRLREPPMRELMLPSCQAVARTVPQNAFLRSNSLITRSRSAYRMTHNGTATGRPPATQCDRRGSSSRCARALVFVLALAAAGCQFPWALDDGDHSASKAPRLQRESAMNTRWQNRPLAELIAALGEPPLIMSIPGGGNPPGFVVVYGVDPLSGCIDAFALFYGGDAIIRVYHCR